MPNGSIRTSLFFTSDDIKPLTLTACLCVPAIPLMTPLPLNASSTVGRNDLHRFFHRFRQRQPPRVCPRPPAHPPASSRRSAGPNERISVCSHGLSLLRRSTKILLKQRRGTLQDYEPDFRDAHKHLPFIQVAPGSAHKNSLFQPVQHAGHGGVTQDDFLCQRPNRNHPHPIQRSQHEELWPCQPVIVDQFSGMEIHGSDDLPERHQHLFVNVFVCQEQSLILCVQKRLQTNQRIAQMNVTR